jgi:hypothetical protein
MVAGVTYMATMVKECPHELAELACQHALHLAEAVEENPSGRSWL